MMSRRTCHSLFCIQVMLKTQIHIFLMQGIFHALHFCTKKLFCNNTLKKRSLYLFQSCPLSNPQIIDISVALQPTEPPLKTPILFDIRIHSTRPLSPPKNACHRIVLPPPFSLPFSSFLVISKSYSLNNFYE